jgi:hypothetical protein
MGKDPALHLSCSQMTYSVQDRTRKEAGVIYCFKMLSKIAEGLGEKQASMLGHSLPDKI